MLIFRFENLKMMKHEIISYFNSKLYDITNETFTFEEKDLDTKLVRKTLRSLPERFLTKSLQLKKLKM